MFAVPAGILDPNSQGVNDLIKDGAKPVTCAQDILEEYEGIRVPVRKTPLPPAESPETESYQPDGLSEEALAFFQALSSEPRHITEICAQTSLSMAKALSAATELELCGVYSIFFGKTVCQNIDGNKYFENLFVFRQKVFKKPISVCF